MKPSLIFSQYVWLVNTLRRYDRMTLEELNDKWIRDEVADGNPLSRSTFNYIFRSIPTQSEAA